MSKLTVAMAASLLALAAVCWTKEPPARPAPRPVPEPIVERIDRQTIGVAYGPYRDGQTPNCGPHPSQAQIDSDMPLLKLMANTIRSYNLLNGEIGEKVLTAAQRVRLRLFLGLWLSGNEAADDAEIEELRRLRDTIGLQGVTAIVVGNETLLRGELTVDELINRIQEVRAIAPGIPVTTGETWFTLLNEPDIEDLVEEIDLLLPHIHSYWDGVLIEDAVDNVFERLDALEAAYPGMPLVIGETGWPTGGNTYQGAVPSVENQRLFLEEFLCRALGEGVDFIFFSAFDEKWKGEDDACDDPEPNGVGAHWGFYTSDRMPKHPGIRTLRRCPQ